MIMNKIVNGVANDYEFPNLYDPNISYSKAYTEQLLAEKDKEIERLNNIIDDLKQKNNLAENILYDYLYNDGKITKEKYEQFKGLKEGTNER